MWKNINICYAWWWIQGIYLDTILHAFLHVEIFQDKQREEVNSVTTQA